MFPPFDVIIYLLAKHSLLTCSVYPLGLPEHKITKIPSFVTLLTASIVLSDKFLSLSLNVPSISIKIAYTIKHSFCKISCFTIFMN